MADKFQDKYRIPSARWQNWDYSWNGAYFITICTAGRECVFGHVETPDPGVSDELETNDPVETPDPGVSNEFERMATKTPGSGVSTELAMGAIKTPGSGVSTVVLSEIGKIAQHFWYEIPKHFPFAELGEFVVMPNHVHGIIVIDKNDNEPFPFLDLDTVAVETPDPGVSVESYTNDQVGTPGSGVSDEFERMATETPESGVSTELVQGATETPGSGVSTEAASKKWKPGILGVIINQYKRICTIHARKIHPNFDWQSRFHDHVIRNDGAYQRIAEYIQNNPTNWQEDQFYME